MADLHFMISVANKMNKKENYEDDKKKNGNVIVEKFSIASAFSWIWNLLYSLILILIIIYAIRLSWRCNSKCSPKMDSIEKIIRAFFAGMFSFFYLIVYYFLSFLSGNGTWSSQCKNCKLPKL
jgi:hypothetical protein